jgi:UDP-glucose 4-epimerase
MRILATGGAGYIGSHVVLTLLEAGHEVVVIDDFSSGSPRALERVQELTGARCEVYQGDLGDRGVLMPALERVDAVIHFAAFKAVGESMACPERYFRNNLGGMATLLEAMVEAGVRRVVYSSSAAVYGSQEQQPIPEDVPLHPDSPYGLTKLQGERWLEWMVQRRGWSATSLRYFNPVGAHPSGHIGEPIEGGNNLFPRILEAYQDSSKALTVFGTDYDTPDGTCLRDYIHVMDLARAHLLALQAQDGPAHGIYNVGTGRPLSVREVLEAFERITGRRVPHGDGPRRPGDVMACSAHDQRFREAVGFVAEHGLDEMVRSAWAWAQNNPGGYA